MGVETRGWSRGGVELRVPDGRWVRGNQFRFGWIHLREACGGCSAEVCQEGSRIEYVRSGGCVRGLGPCAGSNLWDVIGGGGQGVAELIVASAHRLLFSGCCGVFGVRRCRAHSRAFWICIPRCHSTVFRGRSTISCASGWDDGRCGCRARAGCDEEEHGGVLVMVGLVGEL